MLLRLPRPLGGKLSAKLTDEGDERVTKLPMRCIYVGAPHPSSRVFDPRIHLPRKRGRLSHGMTFTDASLDPLRSAALRMTLYKCGGGNYDTVLPVGAIHESPVFFCGERRDFI